MAKKQTQKKQTGKRDRRKVAAGVLALTLAALLLLPMVTMIVGGAGAVTQSEIDSLKEEQAGYQDRVDELEDQLSQLESEQAEAEAKRKNLEAQLNAIDAEIQSIDAQIDYYDGQIAQYDEQIAQKEAERVEAVAKEEEQFELFCERVRAMEEAGDVSYWAVLFNASDFSDLLDRAMMVEDIMAYDNWVRDELIATRQEIEQLKADLEAARAEQQAARDEQQAALEAQQEARDRQAAKVAEAQALLDQINADADEVNRQLDAENAAMAEVNEEIARKQKELEAQRQENNIVFDTGSGYHWPLPGHYKLTSAFGYRIHPITGKPHSHTGIDIPAPGGTPIEACMGGQVITSTYHSSYGNYVVIDHGNGCSTLYAHMSSRAVSEGQIVTQGQVIGYVGTTGSSTGNHLHLEVRVNYQRIDPESWFPSLPFDRAYNR